MSMGTSLSKTKKIVSVFIFVSLLVISTLFIQHQRGTPYKLLIGNWQITEDYILPPIGYNSTFASSEDMVGEVLNVYEKQNQLFLKRGEDVYYLTDTVDMERQEFSSTYIILDYGDLDRFSYPITEWVFENDSEEIILTAIILLVDSDHNVYVRYNDAVGDLAIFLAQRK